jgi:hypothetical protein
LVLVAAALGGFCSSASAQVAPITLVAGTEVRLVTAEPLSSKRQVKGDLVRLTVADDVRVGATIVIPSGTEAVGQVIDARAKGAMGMNGRLVVRPLYVRIGERTVRLTGSEREKASIEPGAVLGMVALGSAAFTGRSAEIPAGTPLRAMVERTVTLAP